MTETVSSIELLLTDQRSRWRRGEPANIEAYFEQYPNLRADADAVLKLIQNEIVLREASSETPQLKEYLGRFGEYQVQLRELFEAQRTLRLEGVPSPIADAAKTDRIEFPIIPGYEILAELGRGGMGVVYKARQAALKRVVALKMILAGPHADPAARTRFRTEAEAIARLQHPNIVQIHDVGEHDGRPFLALEFVEEGNLDEKVADKPQTEGEAAALVQTLASAVHYMHQRGILHRDLKPNNVLLAADGTPKITDFGLAKLRDADAGITKTHALLGTPNYMPPEQAAGDARNIGVTADVYSLGAILYELLTGRPPFEGTTLLKTLDQVRHQEPVSPRRLRGRMSADLETICLKCLEKEPANRYATAEALAKDLHRFLDGQSIQARPIASWRRACRWAWRRPVLMACGLALAALMCVVALSIAHFRAQDELARLQADDRYREFARWRDEAFFCGMLGPEEGALFQGAEANVNLQRAESAARQALSLASINPEQRQADWTPEFPVSRKPETLTDCYGLLLVLASVRSQQGGRDGLEEAVRVLDRASQLGQTRSLQLRRADFLERLGKTADAKSARAQASAVAPDGAMDQFLLGEEAYRRGDWDEARDAFNRAVALQPAHFWARFFLSICHLKSQRWDAAKEGLSGCISQQPDFVWPYLFRSFANEKLQRREDAEADFRKALQLDPKDDARYVLHLTRGILHFNQSEWDRAAADFRDAQTLKPEQYNAYANLAQVYLARKQFAQAEAAMADALKRQPPAEIVVGYHVERARNQLRAGNAAEAVRACDAALALTPNASAAHEVRGRALLALKRFADAEAALNRFLKMDGKAGADTFLARGQARMQLGKFADAIDDYTRALEKRPDAEVYQHRGWAHFFADAWKLASRDFSKAIELDAEPGDAYVGRGLARVTLGDYRGALADADQALEQELDSPEMMHNLACIFAQASAKVTADGAEPKREFVAAECRRRAVQTIRKTLALISESERAAFWRDKIAPDPALAPLHHDPGFREMQAAFSAATSPK
jgi:eukaryotic-like serine/threonine-protein kinase